MHSTDGMSRQGRLAVQRGHGRRLLARLLSTVLAASPLLGAQAQPFPAVIELSSLLPNAGGDGSEGSVVSAAVQGGAQSLGASVAWVGDVNDDGFDDALITAPSSRVDGLPDAGQVYLLYGTPDGLPAQFSVSLLDPAAGGDGSRGMIIPGLLREGRLGTAGRIGDVNGDGIDDLALGMTEPNPSPGLTFVIYGRSDLPAVFPLRSLLVGDGSDGAVLVGAGMAPRAAAGSTVGGDCDVNGDGIDDLLIGDFDIEPSGVANSGAVFVVFGDENGLGRFLPLATLLPQNGGDGSRGFVIVGGDGDSLGFWGGAAGDVNADGICDLLYGPYLVFGSLAPFPPLLDAVSLNPEVGGDGSVGVVLEGRIRAGSRAGDVNHDGIEDLVLGDELAEVGGRTEVGQAFVLYGRDTGWPARVDVLDVTPEQGGDGTIGFVLRGAARANGERTGDAVSAAGDVDGDGIDDLMIGASDLGPFGRAGGVYVVFGRDGGLPAEFDLGTLLVSGGGDGSQGVVLQGFRGVSDTGATLAGTGDFNGDGVPDLLVGAAAANTQVGQNAGEAYIVYGRQAPPP
ncbi:MAG: integrin alpha [Pseudomonadota bacterium]